MLLLHIFGSFSKVLTVANVQMCLDEFSMRKTVMKSAQSTFQGT